MRFCKPVWGIITSGVNMGGWGVSVCSVSSKWLLYILLVFRGIMSVQCRFLPSNVKILVTELIISHSLRSLSVLFQSCRLAGAKG